MMLNVTKLYLSHGIESMVQRPGHPPSKHKTNLQLHIPKWKEVGLGSTSHIGSTRKNTNMAMGQGEDKCHRYNQQSQKDEVVLDKAYQPPQRRPMDLACQHLEIIRQEKTTRETSQAVERRPGQIWPTGGTRYGSKTG